MVSRRRLAYRRTGKTSVVFVELGAKINNQYLLGEGFWPRVTASVQDAAISSGRCMQQDGAPSHTARSIV